jgi:hypothetical protein
MQHNPNKMRNKQRKRGVTRQPWKRARVRTAHEGLRDDLLAKLRAAEEHIEELQADNPTDQLLSLTTERDGLRAELRVAETKINDLTGTLMQAQEELMGEKLNGDHIGTNKRTDTMAIRCSVVTKKGTQCTEEANTPNCADEYFCTRYHINQAPHCDLCKTKPTGVEVGDRRFIRCTGCQKVWHRECYDGDIPMDDDTTSTFRCSKCSRNAAGPSGAPGAPPPPVPATAPAQLSQEDVQMLIEELKRVKVENEQLKSQQSHAQGGVDTQPSPHMAAVDIVGKNLVGLALGLETLRLGGTQNQAPHPRQDVFNTFMQAQGTRVVPPQINYTRQQAPRVPILDIADRTGQGAKMHVEEGQ